MGFIELLIQALDLFKKVLEMALSVRILLSWINQEGNTFFLVRIIYELTEPILAPIRKLIYKSPFGGSFMILDFSPIVAFFFINIVFSILKIILTSFL